MLDESLCSVSVYNCCGERLHLNFIDRETQRLPTNTELGSLGTKIKWNELNISDDFSFRNANKASSAKPHPSCQKKCPYWSDPDPRPRVAQKMPPLIGVARAIRIDKKTRSWPHWAPEKGIFPPRFSSSGWLRPGWPGQGWSQGSEHSGEEEEDKESEDRYKMPSNSGFYPSPALAEWHQ